MKIMIIRHAEPDYSIDSLTEKGWREAELLRKRLSKVKIDDFYCSPLGRAKDTAKGTLEAHGAEAEICEWLEEFNAPVVRKEANAHNIPWDMLPSYWTERDELFSIDTWLENEIMCSGPVEKRYGEVCKGLDELLAKYGYVKEGKHYRVEKECDKTIALFCHFGVECVLLSRLLGISPTLLWHGFIALPSSVTLLCSEEREKGIASFRCQYFGDLSHFAESGEEASFAGRFCELYSNEDERH